MCMIIRLHETVFAIVLITKVTDRVICTSMYLQANICKRPDTSHNDILQVSGISENPHGPVNLVNAMLALSSLNRKGLDTI